MITDFQTPPEVCSYMVSLLPNSIKTVLEPTPGQGNLVTSLKNFEVTAPNNFFDVRGWFDAVVMNPPFSPMSLGYKILYQVMDMTDIIIALMPWLVLINSSKRVKDITDFGLVSVTHLPRSVFYGSRVQTCILNMKRHYFGETELKFY